MKPLNILIGCECSGTIRNAFARRGHNAWSCDLKPSTSPGNHIQGDIFEALDNGNWDKAIIHPPCTFLAKSGEQWLYHPDDKHLPPRKRRPSPHYPNRKEDQDKAIAFFKRLLAYDIPLCLENPQPMQSVLNAIGRPSQIIQPYWFGDAAQKTTYLWLKGLTYLYPTNPVHKGEFVTFKSGKKMPKWYADAKHTHTENTQTTRSVTFSGIAEAMADFWGTDKYSATTLF